MAKKAKVKPPVEIEPKKNNSSARGKRSRRKGANYERDIAKIFSKKFGIEFIRTPQSGGFAKKIEGTEQFRGDIVPAHKGTGFRLHIEAKNQQTWALPSWLKQAEADCPEDAVPIVVFHKANTSRNYVALSLEEFLRIIDMREVVCKDA